MTTLAGVIDQIFSVAAVTAKAQDRIFPVIAPQGVAKPYVVWRRNGGDPLSTIASAQSRNRQFVDVLIGAYAESFDAADELSEALQDAVNAGAGGKATIGPPIDGYEPETTLFSVTFQARLSYRAT